MNRRYFCNKILYRVLNFLLDFFLGWLIEASTTFLPSSNFNQLAFGSYRNLKFHLTSLTCISNAQSAERSKNLSCLVLPVQSARSSHVNTARRLYHFTREEGTTQANKKCHDVAYFFWLSQPSHGSACGHHCLCLFGCMVEEQRGFDEAWYHKIHVLSGRSKFKRNALGDARDACFDATWALLFMRQLMASTMPMITIAHLLALSDTIVHESS